MKSYLNRRAQFMRDLICKLLAKPTLKTEVLAPVHLVYRLAGLIVPLLPSNFAYWLFARIGDLVYRLDNRARRISYSNVRHVLGKEADEATVERVVRQVFRNALKSYCDLFRLPHLKGDEVGKSVAIHGLEHVETALAAGKGVVLVSAHFGGEILVQTAPYLSYKLTTLAEHLKPERLFQYIKGLRESHGVEMLPVDGPLIKVIRALRRNELVAVAGDRDITESGLVVDFFGAPARLPDGHVQLAMRTGAKLVVGFGIRRPDNNFDIYIEPPLELEETGDFKRDVRTNLEKIVEIFERYIGQYPEQWIMLQPIWLETE